MNTLIVRGERVAIDGRIRAAAVHVASGRIAAVEGYDQVPDGVPLLEAGGLVVLPGLVDTHVHINDPGRTDWEGFDTATSAAAAGGVTTVVDMPLNSIPSTTTVDALDQKLRAAEGRCHVDVGFWGGVVPGNTADLEPLAQAGVAGFKCFMSPSGVDEFAHVGEADLRDALPVLARLGLPLLVHAELPARLRAADPAADPRHHRTWLESRPPEAEQAAVELLIALAREFGARIHIVHLASGAALPGIRNARAGGVALTVETCPHYLSFAAEEVADGATAFKCAPPIRSRANQDALWGGLEDGDIDLVATDHSPAPASLKHLDDGDFLQAWGGIASLQLGLAAVWTQAARRGIGIGTVVRWMSEAPARLAGLAGSKGRIAPGFDADLVLWDPDAETAVDPSALFHRHPVTPYAGMRLRGRVHTTLLRGQVIYDGDRIVRPSSGVVVRNARIPPR